MDILYSEVYIGTIVNNRIEQNQRTGYKTKRRKSEEWTVVENCHEPIISRELYEAAHKKLDRKSQAKKRDLVILLRGFFSAGAAVMP